MWTIKRILVPLDGSALSERALPVAISLAAKYDAEVILLRVLDVPIPSRVVAHPESMWIQEALQDSHREAEHYLSNRRLDLRSEGIRVREVVFDTSPAEDILFVALNEEIDLIIMSSHGSGGATRWPAGSVAAKVMQHSPCPVLLIRHDEGYVREESNNGAQN